MQFLLRQLLSSPQAPFFIAQTKMVVHFGAPSSPFFTGMPSTVVDKLNLGPFSIPLSLNLHQKSPWTTPSWFNPFGISMITFTLLEAILVLICK